MIFFYYNKEQQGPETAVIPRVLDTEIPREKWMLLPWNKVLFDDGSRRIGITDLDKLRQCVIEAAMGDAVCIEMNKNAFAAYGLYLFAPERQTPGPDNGVAMENIVNRIFWEWAHPMIGNIMNSPLARPMVWNNQYSCNWSRVSSLACKETLAALCSKMGDLERSGHDQVRICGDMVTLARAILGEITSLAVRRIEKLFAIELCGDNLLALTAGQILINLLQKFETGNNWEALKKSFNSQGGLKSSQYLYYYLEYGMKYLKNMEERAKKQKEEEPRLSAQWNFFFMLIQNAPPQKLDMGMFEHLGYMPIVGDVTVDNMIRQYCRLPYVIRIIAVLNAFRYLGRTIRGIGETGITDENKYSVAQNDDGKFAYVPAAAKLPELVFSEKSKLLVWSCNRDESHETTITYRKYLMPLWAGPSGHAHGLMSFLINNLELWHIPISIESQKLRLPTVVLTMFFLFWRLYYDKRVSPVHTITETYEASIWAYMWAAGGAPPPDCDSLEPVVLQGNETALDILLLCERKDGGIINPIRLVNTLKTHYYDKLSGRTPQEKYGQLKESLDAARDRLSVQYNIPLWSQPILLSPRSSEQVREAAGQERPGGKGEIPPLYIFVERNAKIYVSRPVPAPFSDLRQSKMSMGTGGNPLSDLYEYLKKQGSVVTLDRKTLAEADMSAVFTRVLLTERFLIRDAIFSELTEEGFTIDGQLDSTDSKEPWTRNGCPAKIRFGISGQGRLTIHMALAGSLPEVKLCNYYFDLPETIKGNPALSKMILTQTREIVIHEWGISFQAKINTQTPFWEGAKEFVDLEPEVLAQCEIRADRKGAVFEACIQIESFLRIREGIAIKILSLTFQSGMETYSQIRPRFWFDGSIGTLGLSMIRSIDGHLIAVRSRPGQESVFTWSDLCTLFGLPGEINILPGNLTEQFSGQIGIYQAEIELDTQPLSVRRLELTVSTEKPWQLLEERISFQPYLYVGWKNPFDGQRRKTEIQVLGCWQLGNTGFDILVFPDTGEIQASMQENQRLDVTAALETFVKGVSLPEVSISKMSLEANYKEKTYQITLEAEKCMEFVVCGTSVGIKELEFSLEYARNTVQNVNLSGVLSLGVVELRVLGVYRGEEDWEITAYGLSDLEVKFSELWQGMAEEVPGLGDAALLPEEFLNFKIGEIYGNYGTREKRFEIYIVLEQIVLTENFRIDSVLAAVRMGAGGLEELKLHAGFYAAGASLLLEIDKNREGYLVHGGTPPEQSLALGKLLSEFAGDILGYQVTLPGEMEAFTINEIGFTYSHGGKEHFAFDCAAGYGGEDSGLKRLFSAKSCIHITAEKTEQGWQYGFTASALVTVGVHEIACSYVYNGIKGKKNSIIQVSYQAKEQKTVLSVGGLLKAVGIESFDESMSYITDIGISEVELSIDFMAKRFNGRLGLNGGGSIAVDIGMEETAAVHPGPEESRIRYSIVAESSLALSLEQVPLAGELAGKLLKPATQLAVTDLRFYALSEPDKVKGLPAGAGFLFRFDQKEYLCRFYEPAAAPVQALQDKALVQKNAPASKTLWLQIHKTIGIFTIHRIGVGMENARLILLLDVGLNVSPITFELIGAGIGIRLSDFQPRFVLEGFGVSFQNSLLTLHGELRYGQGHYSGALIVQIKGISVFTVADYSKAGSLLAYGMVSGRIGGPPAFQITGIALGFGYHKQMKLPDVEHVQDFPLIKGAVGKLAKENLLGELNQVICDAPGENFGAAGIRFDTFGIADSFALLTLNFGKTLEIGLLGVSDIVMPPVCPAQTSPLLYARLALKASILPDQGVAAVEARLTPESYIFSRDCRLSGGFAFYMWFGGDNKGDFVVTLGGYHPSYLARKPFHYPMVPRLGFLWEIGSHLRLEGEMYFALTPSAMMAGGSLNATYTLGPLQAYFRAKVDFLLSWKPFYYEAEIGVVVGVSLQIKVLFVKLKMTLELGAQLHIWGPDFSGKARISCYVVSFDIAFGAGAKTRAKDIDWKEFCTSFLPPEEKKNGQTAPVKISFLEGLKGEMYAGEGICKAVGAGSVTLEVESSLPVLEARSNGQGLRVDKVPVSVRPMGKAGKNFISRLDVTVTDCFGNSDHFRGSVLKKNLPAALWGGEGELIKDVPCGIRLETETRPEKVFPEKHSISLDDLYRKGTIVIPDAFIPMKQDITPDYTDENTILRFAQTVTRSDVAGRRKSFLQSLGVETGEEITMKRYADRAESYLDQEVLIAVT